MFAVTWSARGSNEWRKILLLLASWVFYGAWDWRFVALLILSALLNWGAARLIALSPEEAEARRKGLMLVGRCWPIWACSASSNITTFSSNSSAVCSNAIGFARDMPLMQIVLPVGISFFTFQGMSYLIDVYKGHAGSPPPGCSTSRC